MLSTQTACLSMKKIKKKLMNFYYLIMCFWIITGRSLYIILKNKFTTLSQPVINKVARKGAIKILNMVKANYVIRYAQSIEFKKDAYYIFMSNHQSVIDLPLVYATIMGTVRFLTKKELFEYPLFGKALSISGCIPVDRENFTKTMDCFDQAKKRADSQLLWIFPEGTRSRTGELLLFKAGGFRLARELSAYIVPAGIKNTRFILEPGKLSFGLHQDIELKIGKPIDTRDYQTIDKQALLMKEVKSQILELMH